MCWNAVCPVPLALSSLSSSIFYREGPPRLLIYVTWKIRLAYSELYITLGTLFRRFENMQSNVLTEEDRTIVDCFASCYPLDATKFHVSARVE